MGVRLDRCGITDQGVVALADAFERTAWVRIVSLQGITFDYRLPTRHTCLSRYYNTDVEILYTTSYLVCHKTLMTVQATTSPTMEQRRWHNRSLQTGVPPDSQ